MGTGILQSLYYNLTYRVGERRPQRGEPLYEVHRRRVHLFVLILYLTYTFLQALYDIRLDPDFYSLLGVSTFASEREIKSRFRRLAVRFHPDKVGPDVDATGDEAFSHLKLAQDTLISPVKRFAYDRFGPAIVRYTPHEHEKLQSKGDYVYAGLRSLLPQYIQGGISLVLMNYFLFPKYGQFWRYFFVVSLALLELSLLTHEWSPSPGVSMLGSTLHTLLPDLLPAHLLPYQVLAVARRMSISVNIFISQLAPPGHQQREAAQARQDELLLSHLSQATGRIDQESTNLLNLGYAPYKGDRETVERLRNGMTEGISLGAIRQTPEVKEAVAHALERRKRSAMDIDEDLVQPI